MKVNSGLKNIGLVALGAASALALAQAVNLGNAATTNADTYKLLNLFGEVYDRDRKSTV